MKGKKGALPALGVVIMIMLAGIGVVYMIDWGVNKVGGDKSSTLSVTGDGGTKVVVDPEGKITEKALTSCDGIASVKLLYDDLNYYKVGTDVGGNITLYAKKGPTDKSFTSYKKLVLDDATTTTVPVLTEFKGLASNDYGRPIGAHFGEEITFSTGCTDKDLQPSIKPASAPTITIVNDDAITKNSDSNDEPMSASSKYYPCMTVKSPSEACSARYGAIVAFEYNSSAINKISSSHLVGANSQFLVSHTNFTGRLVALDQYNILKWDGGELCDGDKVEICFDVETTSATIGEDDANMLIHWYPINKDLNAKTLDLITGIYDEDNNLITVGNTNAWYYTS